MDAAIILALASFAFATFTVNLAYGVIDYRNSRRDRRTSARAARFRYAVMSLVIWIGVESIWVSSILRASPGVPLEVRQFVGALNGALVSGALLAGGIALVVSRVRDKGFVDAE